jgi:hypothetical protein
MDLIAPKATTLLVSLESHSILSRKRDGEPRDAFRQARRFDEIQHFCLKLF